MKIFDQGITFVKEAYIELKKVSWLSKKEVIATTIIVIIFVVIVAIYVASIDFILTRIVMIFIGRR